MSEPQKQKNTYRPTMLYILIGLVAGVALTGVAVVTQESQLSFDETVAALEQAISQQGWVVSTLMPCTLAVWEGDDGKVYLSKMNMPLMAKMFGGNIARVMGGRVARDEYAILSGIVQD